MSKSDSDPSGVVITGSFGAEDIFHTILDIFQQFGEDLNKSKMPPNVREIVESYTNAEKRRPLRDKDGEPRKQKLQILRQLADNPDALIAAIRLKKNIHPLSEKAIRQICKIDSDIYKKYSNVPEYIRGPLAFLLQMLCMADEAHEASENKSAELDKAVRLADNATHNGASAENIGSHSLLAKDSPRKAPLYQQAMNLAIRTATYIAEVMVRQVERRKTAAARFEEESTRQQGSGKPTNTLAEIPPVDWLHLLQHFLCHPDECEEQWFVEAMKNTKAPTHYVMRYSNKRTASKRMQLDRFLDLAGLYMHYGQDVDGDWKVTIDEATRQT